MQIKNMSFFYMLPILFTLLIYISVPCFAGTGNPATGDQGVSPWIIVAGALGLLLVLGAVFSKLKKK